jgi:ABC-type transporter Mla MlaB component
VTSTAEIRNGICVVTLSGEFDRGNIEHLRLNIASCLAEASSVIFDFEAVTFANGGVLSLLLDVLEGLPDGGWLGIVRPLSGIEKSFRAAGLSRQPNFWVFSTMDEAFKFTGRS